MITLVWNEADGHYELRDKDEFLMAIAKSDIGTIMDLLGATEEGEIRDKKNSELY